MDLKPYKDAVEASQDAATNVAVQIDALMQDGKLDEALTLQPELDKAEAKVQEAQKLYDSMTKVTERGSEAQKFVPASEERDHQLEGPEQDEKVKTRSQFDALNAKEKMAFVKADGQVIPDEAKE